MRIFTTTFDLIADVLRKADLSSQLGSRLQLSLIVAPFSYELTSLFISMIIALLGLEPRPRLPRQAPIFDV